MDKLQIIINKLKIINIKGYWVSLLSNLTNAIPSITNSNIWGGKKYLLYMYQAFFKL